MQIANPLLSGRVQMFYSTPLQDIHLNARKF